MPPATLNEPRTAAEGQGNGPHAPLAVLIRDFPGKEHKKFVDPKVAVGEKPISEPPEGLLLLFGTDRVSCPASKGNSALG